MITIAAMLVGLYVWSRYAHWEKFAFTTDTDASAWPRWVPRGGADISRLRFRDAIFTVQRGDGKTFSRDVSSVLDGMAKAYEGASDLAVAALTLPGLHPFSFVVPGQNTRAEVAPGAERAWPWCWAGTGEAALCGARASLVGYVKTI